MYYSSYIRSHAVDVLYTDIWNSSHLVVSRFGVQRRGASEGTTILHKRDLFSFAATFQLSLMFRDGDVRRWSGRMKTDISS
jgi:hypothetical protein